MTPERHNLERQFFRAAAMFFDCRTRGLDNADIGPLLGEMGAMVEMRMILEEATSVL